MARNAPDLRLYCLRHPSRGAMGSQQRSCNLQYARSGRWLFYSAATIRRNFHQLLKSECCDVLLPCHLSFFTKKTERRPIATFRGSSIPNLLNLAPSTSDYLNSYYNFQGRHSKFAARHDSSWSFTLRSCVHGVKDCFVEKKLKERPTSCESSPT